MRENGIRRLIAENWTKLSTLNSVFIHDYLGINDISLDAKISIAKVPPY